MLTGSSKVIAQYNLRAVPQTMNSLKVKILGLVTAIVVAIISLSATVNFQLQKQMINSIKEHNSQMLSETVKSSIANAMRFGRAEELPNILSNLKTQEPIKSARILDLGGKILNSSDSGEIGKIVSQDELTALRLRISGSPAMQAWKNT